MTLLWLYLLALLDGLLCGGRVSMGRCALIRKRGYYARALARGLLGAQVISTLALVALLLVGRFSPHQTDLVLDLEDAVGLSSVCGGGCREPRVEDDSVDGSAQRDECVRIGPVYGHTSLCDGG